MTLKDLEQYSPITIQCHDNPDADAIGAGYGLYCYFSEKGIPTRLVYSGRNKIQKSNLCLLVDKLNIPIEYIKSRRKEPLHLEGLLITVDCQYGAGNVTGLTADVTAIIDHHWEEIDNVPLSIISPKLGSCSTLVWKLLKQEGYRIQDDNYLGTALYYGLYSDTNQFSELYNPLDLDMRDEISYNKSLITLFRNSNLSLSELEIAGIAMIRYSFNEDYQFAVIKAKPCDPNILGLISDFLLQVDVIKTCVVFNQVNDGYKFSVRSCIREVNASELAAYLAEGIGSGGGHYEKAGGFISMRLYEEKFPTLHAEGYFNNRMTQYFDSFDIIYPQNYQIDLSIMKQYEKRKVPMGYVKADEILPVSTPIVVRTLEGDIELTVEKDLYILIGIKGEVYPIRKEQFEQTYLKLNKKYGTNECVIKADYVPTIKSRETDQYLVLTDYANVCIPTGEVKICAKPLERGVKIFTSWDKDKYMMGRPGDYLTVCCDDLQDIHVVEKDIFANSYDEIS